MSRKITVKYGKQTHQLVIDAEDTLEELQAKIYGLTSVPPKNMKILNKGSKVADEKAFKDIKDGVSLMVMGTKDSNMMEKIEVAVDTEKFKKEQVKEDINYGIENIGNTCYINSCVQMIKGTREMGKKIKNYEVPADNYGFRAFVSDLADVVRSTNRQTSNKPMKFVMNFLTMAPEFGKLGQQQDAEECWQKLLFFINKVMTVPDEKSKKEVSLVDKLFEIEYHEEQYCPQLPDEKPKHSITTSRKLNCTIGGNSEVKINTIQEGINIYLNDSVSKTSETDGKIHKYLRKIRMSNLPPYLVLHEVRFFWKEANELGGTKATGTKITRAIDFPLVLDISEFCTEELKEKLKKGKALLEENRKRKEARQANGFQAYLAKIPPEKFKDEKTSWREYKAEMQALDSKELDKDIYREFDTGIPTGQYNLVGVITHLGQSVYSGHYMAWVHQTGKLWHKYDDDTVYEKKPEDVLQLKGGLANLQMAYVLLYRRKEIVEQE